VRGNSSEETKGASIVAIIRFGYNLQFGFLRAEGIVRSFAINMTFREDFVIDG